MSKVNVLGIAKQLLSPFSYLTKFEHGAKSWYNFWYPLLFTVLTIPFLFVFIGQSSIPSVIRDINNFIANLPGFFIAALAAIATFGNARIDDEIGGVKVKVLDSTGDLKPLPVSRRRFLSSMFSYLTALSMFVVVATNIALRIHFESTQLQHVVNFMGFTAFFFALWQLILTSLLGLYYLGERLHEA